MYERQVARFDGIIQKLNLKFHGNLEIEHHFRLQEKELFDQEIELNRKITEKTLENNRKLIEEMRQLK
jgi:hypothetical protein